MNQAHIQTRLARFWGFKIYLTKHMVSKAALTSSVE
jgi:hypothetical protein